MTSGQADKPPFGDETTKEIENLLEIRNPLEKSLQSFERFINWGLAVSAGTLLWFAGSLNKFALKCDTGNIYMPYKWLYVLSIGFLFVSVVILSYIRIKLYYNSYQFYQFDSNREQYRAWFKNILEKQKLAKSDPSQANDLFPDFHAEFEEAHKQAINAGSWAVLVNEFIILVDRTKNFLIASTGTYILGVLAGLFYVILFSHENVTHDIDFRSSCMSQRIMRVLNVIPRSLLRLG